MSLFHISNGFRQRAGGEGGEKKVVESYKCIPNGAILKLPVEMKNWYVRVKGPSWALIKRYIT